MTNTGLCDAYVSADGVYRYWLTRVWNDALPLLPWVMLNPSTADHMNDDPTIKRVCGFSHREGFGGALVMNLFALRATDPAVMLDSADPIGPENAEWLTEMVGRQVAAPAPIMCGWGANAGVAGFSWAAGARSLGAQLVCLGRTAEGHPKHPLYLSGDTPVEQFA